MWIACVLTSAVVVSLGPVASQEGGRFEVCHRVERGPFLELTVDLPVGVESLSEQVIEAEYRRHALSLPAGIHLRLLAKGSAGLAKPIESFLEPVTAPPRKRGEARGAPMTGQMNRSGQTSGALAGKTVFLSPGHGWFYDSGDQRWETQRPVTHGIVEDFHSADVVNEHLARRLENMGAEVWIVRERDRNPDMMIVDETDSDPNSGTCTEVGPAWRFVDSSLAGYGHEPLPHGSATNPLALGAARLMSTTSGPADASVTWTPNFSRAGLYAVYASFGSYTNRPRDVHYRILHAAGTSDVFVNQTRDGFTWRYLGHFPFDAGFQPGAQGVVLSNETQDSAASWISFDAIRFGGGAGDIDAGGGVSTRVRQEECARMHTQFLGAPSSVYAYYTDDRSSDVVSRPRYAAWENEVGEDSIYIAWHTNAPSPAVGTSSFIYSSNPTPGSAALQTAVHTELIGDLRGGYDSNWVDRGMKSAPFGEVNPAHNPEMPSMLLEAAFHSTASDAMRLRDGTCIDVMTRGVAQGVVKYFAQRDGVSMPLAPEPPEALVAKVAADGSIDVSWSAPAVGAPGLLGDAPTSYRVFASRKPRAFGAAVLEVKDTQAHIPPMAGLGAVYVRVQCVNGGGVSLPSYTQGVIDARSALGGGGAAPIRALFVQGYTRRGPYLLAETHELVSGTTPVTWGGSGTLEVRRRWEETINSGDYIVEHARALESWPGLALDSADRAAVASGAVQLGDYDIVLWASGRQAEVFSDDPVDDTSLTASERAIIEHYLRSGGCLCLSGAEVAYDLDRDADPADPPSTFLRTILGASYVADGAGTFGVHSLGTFPFASLLPFTFNDGSQPGYAVEWPDVIAPVAPGTAVLGYDSFGSAGILHSGPGRVLYFGFPLESVTSTNARADLLQAGIRALVFGR